MHVPKHMISNKLNMIHQTEIDNLIYHLGLTLVTTSISKSSQPDLTPGPHHLRHLSLTPSGGEWVIRNSVVSGILSQTRFISAPLSSWKAVPE